MKKLADVNSSRLAVLLFSAVLFLIFLLFNFMTPYIADDYAYMYGFHDAAPISDITGVFKSMYVHSVIMNGRVIPHGLEQLFFLAPKAVFNVCNSLVMTGLIYLVHRLCSFGKKRNLALYVVISMAYWYFMPVFGQVTLWQVGALNYGWGLAAGVLFITPFAIHFVYPERRLSLWKKIVFSIAAFAFGMYTEITSFIGIFIAAALILLTRIMKKGRMGTWLFVPLASAAAGYAALMMMPAEIAAKGAEHSVSLMLMQLAAAAEMLKSELLPLIIAWACLFIIALSKRAERERTVLSGLLAFSGAAAAAMLSVASYIPERCLCTSALLFISACAVLLPELTALGADIAVRCAGGILAVVFMFSFIGGAGDIWNTYASFEAREDIIAGAVENGERDLVLECIHPKTKYSAFWGISDLNTVNSQEYPNVPMAMYYGVDSIMGM